MSLEEIKDDISNFIDDEDCAENANANGNTMSNYCKRLENCASNN